MKQIIALAILLCLLFSCDNPFTARITNDFIPIDITGNFWIYKNNNDSEKYLEVKENTNNLIFDGREAIIVEENYAETYWFKGEGFVSRHKQVQINFNGQLFTIEERWQHYIEIPMVVGNSWEDAWRDTIDFLNEPLYYVSILQGSVVAIEAIDTQAGEFDNCYKLHFNRIEEIRSSILGDSVSETCHFEWYAPGVGLVQSTQDDQDWKLIDYGNNEEGD